MKYFNTVCIILLLGLLACEETTNDPVEIKRPLPQVSGSYSNFKIANFITNYSRVDVEIDEFKFAVGLGKNKFSQRFDINTGTHDVHVKNPQGHTVWRGDIIFRAYTEATLLFSGYQGSLEGLNSLSHKYIFEGLIDTKEEPATGKLLCNISNWAADSLSANSINLFFSVVNVTTGDTLIHENSTGVRLHNTKGYNIDPAKYKITFYSFGSDYSNSITQELSVGKIYNFICAGDPSRFQIVVDHYMPMAARAKDLYP